MSLATPKLGVKMSPDEAKAFVDGLNKKVIQRWEERVTKGPFMSRFVEGKLPLSAIKTLFQELGQFYRRDQHPDRRLLSQAYRLL